MDAAALNRVKFLAGDDAYAYWQAKGGTSSRLDTALAEYGDLRLVAAYVLEELAEELLAGPENTDGKPQVKRMKEGDSEVEYFAAPEAVKARRARLWLERAGRLRTEAAEAISPSGSSVALDIRTGF